MPGADPGEGFYNTNLQLFSEYEPQPGPTETIPNRAFASAGTSQGHMDDHVKVFTCPSIFGRLSAKNLDWAWAPTCHTPPKLSSSAEIGDYIRGRSAAWDQHVDRARQRAAKAAKKHA